MVKIIKGNILESEENIIIHQVNTEGIMRRTELQDNSPTIIKD